METGSTAYAAPVVLTTDDGIATIMLNRPEVLNALNAAMVSRLHALAAEVETDETIRAVVIRGAGHNFMAGGDVGQFARFLDAGNGSTGGDDGVNHRCGGDADADDPAAAFADLLGQVNAIVLTLRRMRKPVLAVVDGAAAGFGVSLALACDMILAADTARFIPSYTRIGATPDGGVTRHLPLAVGRHAAFELLTAADGVDAQRARELGFVNWVVPADQIDTECDAMARKLAKLPTAAVGRTKMLLDFASDGPLDGHLAKEAKAFVASTRTEDFREGVRAFVEKRRPNFEGR